MTKLLSTIMWFVLMVLLFSCNDEIIHKATGKMRFVNLDHLNFLYEEVTIADKEMAIIHIYSEHPNFQWIDATDEGIACVDDVARAAVVYLRYFEVTGQKESLERAQKLLDFCLYMQADDGLFYNFIYADYSINKTGKTSVISLDWWTGRAVWALGEGYRVFKKNDPDYANLLQQRIKKTFLPIEKLQANYPVIMIEQGFKAPTWLLNSGAADATSELLIGLAVYAQASGDSAALKFLSVFAEGLIAMQLGDEQTFPFGAFLSWKNIWHGWANSQAQALCETYNVTADAATVQAVRQEADGFYRYWIDAGFPREMQFYMQGSPKLQKQSMFPQIAYAMRPAILGALKLYDITKETRYAELAGEMATWYFGNNPAKRIMFEVENGRCLDGILSENDINLNSGAESTIEALYSLLEVESNPIALKKLQSWLDKQ